MREIKFRCWDTHQKRFTNDSMFFASATDGSLRGKFRHPVYIEQYTGLKANGVEICEGDILKCTRKDMDYSDTVAVKYTPGQFVAYNPLCCEVCKSGDGCIEYLSDRVFFEQLWDVEVIGNIHENPELLK